MKKLFALSLLVISVLLTHAQYRTYKNNYDIKTYKYEKTDPYDPTAAALLAVIPGLGHCSVGEPIRGLSFVGLMGGSFCVTVFGAMLAFNVGNEIIPGLFIFGGAAGFFGSYIWSISDASRVAKIKNLAFKDHKLSFHIQPSVQHFAIDNSDSVNLLGGCMQLNF